MLESLYKKYRVVMYNKALGILQSHELAEDAVHEAFVRIARHTGRFESMNGEEPRYLCITIVKNIALNMLRDRGKPMEIPEDLADIPTDIPLAIDLDAAISSLPDDFRQVVILRLRYGFDTIATAKLLGIKQGTVRSRLNRARKSLQAILTGQNAKKNKYIVGGTSNDII